MAKVNWGIDSDEPDDLKGFDVYDGPLPSAGVYTVKLKRLGIKLNRNEDRMLNGLLEISESRPEKKKFNGYSFWFNQNVTDQGKPYVKQFLAALGVSWGDFISKTSTESDDMPTQITKIGRLKIEENPSLKVNAKIDNYQGNTKLAVASFLAKKEEDDEDDEDDDDAPEKDSDAPF